MPPMKAMSVPGRIWADIGLGGRAVETGVHHDELGPPLLGLEDRGYARAYVYGLAELGGTHVLYVLTEHPSQYDLPKAVREAKRKARKLVSQKAQT